MKVLLSLLPRLLLISSLFLESTTAWTINHKISNNVVVRNTPRDVSVSASSTAWFSETTTTTTITNNNEDDDDIITPPVAVVSTEKTKAQILQLGAALDRGQAYNPTSGAYYEETMMVAREKIEQLTADTTKIPTTLEEMAGEWELVLSTVPHGIFRSSPFFMAIQESYEYAEDKEMNGEPKADLFFRLHELQTCSWGVSKVGRVAQRIDPETKYLYSEFDTSLFSLTVIPIVGWFKLLPTFGGCVVTASKCELTQDGTGTLELEVDYTTSRKVPGLSGLPLIGDFIWKLNVPVGAIWKLLPWNKGRAATCRVFVKYVDEDFRVVQDIDGEYFVYTRPVVPRELKLKLD